MYATYAELHCSKSCDRPAKFLRDDWQERYFYPVKGDTTLERETRKYRRGLVCGIHAGAAKRSANSRWGQPAPGFISPIFPAVQKYVDAILNEQAKEYTDKQDRIRLHNAEAKLVVSAQFAQAWVERSAETEATIEDNEHVTSYAGRFRKGWRVKGGGGRHWSDGGGVEVEQSENWPALVSVHSSSSMSPSQARKLASALMAAANLADERDFNHGPK